MTPRDWHSPMAEKGGVRWRWVPLGIEIEGSGIERTPGEPTTITRIWRDYRKLFTHWSTTLAIPVELLLATAATESRGNPKAIRHEPGYVSDEKTPTKISAGLMQTLLSTAREATSLPLTRHDLFDPAVSIHAGAKYIRKQAVKRGTALDPPLVFAAYNAGSLREDKDEPPDANRWDLVCFPMNTGRHIDSAVRWFGDAVAVLTDDSTPPPWTWQRLYVGEPEKGGGGT